MVPDASMSGSRLAGKRAVVTGAGKGIGLGIAQMFAVQGAEVLVHSGSRTNATAARDSIANSTGANVSHVHGPLQDSSTAEAVFDATLSHLGGVDVLVNNAAIDNFEPLADVSEETWRDLLDVNLNGQFLVTKLLIPPLLEARAGAIVNVASTSALVGTPGMAAYSASKGAIVSLTRQMAIEYADQGLRVNSICPGSIDTPMLREGIAAEPDPEEALRKRTSLHPLGRIGTTEDVAYAALYLASDEASFVTGTNLTVDGGFTAA